MRIVAVQVLKRAEVVVVAAAKSNKHGRQQNGLWIVRLFVCWMCWMGCACEYLICQPQLEAIVVGILAAEQEGKPGIVTLLLTCGLFKPLHMCTGMQIYL